MRVDAQQAEHDRRDLSRFGYAQELFREMGGFSNFAISFTCISIFTGAIALFGYGLSEGGPLEMSLGWPLVTVFSLAVAAAMAELCSAFPTSGAMYHWSSALGGPAWGWFTANLNIIGLVAALAGVDYACAQFALPLLGVPSTARNLLIAYAAILVSHALINHYGIDVVAILNDVSAAAHIGGVIVLVVLLLAVSRLQPLSFLTHAAGVSGAKSSSPLLVWGFILGLLQAQWTFTGFDASAHTAEETVDPRRRAPWGMVLSVAISGVVGYALVLALTLAIRDVNAVLTATDRTGNSIPAVIAIVQQALGSRWATPLMGIATLAMWFCGLAMTTSASRAVYSLARDNGTPFARVLKHVSKPHGTPAPAIWLTAVAAFALLVYTRALAVVTAISTIALYVGYILPVILANRRSAWRQQAVWRLGRWSGLVSNVAIWWTAFICVIFVMPPNQLAGETFAILMLVLAALYFFRARHRYAGPAWAGEVALALRTKEQASGVA